MDCSEISERDFEVSEGDPHNFDADGDGIGCEEYDEDDLDCPDISDRNFEVEAGDPNNFDADGDGIGCEEYDDFTPAGEEGDASSDNGDTDTEDGTTSGDDEPQEQNGDPVPVGGVDTGGGATAGEALSAWLVGGAGAFAAAAAGGFVISRRLGREN